METQISGCLGGKMTILLHTLQHGGVIVYAYDNARISWMHPYTFTPQTLASRRSQIDDSGKALLYIE